MSAERPILFSDLLVRAILDGRKTETRRVVRGADTDVCRAVRDGWFVDSRNAPLFPLPRCPYGEPGDTLWVREAFRPLVSYDGAWWPTRRIRDAERYEHRAEGKDLSGYGMDGAAWRPSIHMPRAAARIFLRVTDVRVERVQDITPAGVVAEGLRWSGWGRAVGRDGRDIVCDGHNANAARAGLRHFRSVWDDINAKRGFGWDANPWVWVVAFERIDGSEVRHVA